MNKGRKLKRVLMFHGDDICYNTINLFSDIIAANLRKRGIDVGFIELNSDSLADEYVREINRGFDIAIAVNSQGQEHTYMGGVNVFEYMNAPFVNWMLDHPAEHLPNEEGYIRDYYLLCLDRDHVDYVNDHFPDVRGAFFLPIGGCESSDPSGLSEESFRARQYDVVFTGSHIDPDYLYGEMKKIPEKKLNFNMAIIDQLLGDGRMTLENAVKNALSDGSLIPGLRGFEDYMNAATPATFYLRAYIRDGLVRQLIKKGISIDLFGLGWDSIGNMGKAVIHDQVSYIESASLCRMARLSLNVMPLFRNGLHDRIPTAMLAGSAVITDSSRYIEEILNTSDEDKDIILYDPLSEHDLSDRIISAFEDENRLYEIAMSGQKAAKGRLDWNARTDQLIGIIEGDILAG